MKGCRDYKLWSSAKPVWQTLDLVIVDQLVPNHLQMSYNKTDLTYLNEVSNKRSYLVAMAKCLRVKQNRR